MAQDNGVDKTWAGILAAASGGCMLWSLLKCHQTRAVTEAKTRCALMVFGVANAALTTAVIALAVVIINSQKPSATSSSQLAQWLLAVTQFSLWLRPTALVVIANQPLRKQKNNLNFFSRRVCGRKATAVMANCSSLTLFYGHKPLGDYVPFVLKMTCPPR